MARSLEQFSGPAVTCRRFVVSEFRTGHMSQEASVMASRRTSACGAARAAHLPSRSRDRDSSPRLQARIPEVNKTLARASSETGSTEVAANQHLLEGAFTLSDPSS
jgi:hypothetical protein